MKRIKIKSINSEKLKERGFRYTENGYELQIKDTFRFNHYLVILPNDIYGYAVKTSRNHVWGYEEFLEAMNFRNTKAKENCENIVKELISSGAIELED
ncbi:hypothetical protein [Peptostreptococcus anaerobius]|uniref:hypothetical protein n=1 Tax=Peptostreptococcus anaerobius TaxID=1261 RepID=UPI003D6EA540